MNQETITMSYRETERLRILERVEAKTLSLNEAAELMGIGYRQARRLRRRLRKEGVWGLAHKSRGRTSNCRLDPALRVRVLARYRERYADFGPTFASEKLAEDGLRVSRETLRRWLVAEHLWLGRQVHRVHRKRRARRAHFGELVQIDGSDHEWFEQRAPRCCLMVMIDDATGRIQALFSSSENLWAAREVVRRWIVGFGGVPQALYSDRLSLYHPSREANQAERAQGSRALSQFGQVCWRLGIEMIPAGSPQAKGRVERANGTLQDRLVKELRLANITTIEAANAFLEDGFLEAFNKRFAVEPLEAANYHRAVSAERPLDDLLCLETTRQVQNDWTVTYGATTLQILSQERQPRAKSRVLIRERLDGEIEILQGDEPLAYIEIAKNAMLQPGRLPTPMGVGTAGRSQPSGRTQQLSKPLAKRGATAPRACGPPPEERGHF